MENRVEETPGRQDEIIERVSSIKAKVRERERGASRYEAILLIDSYFWSMSKIAVHEETYSRKKKQEKLKELQEICSRAHEQLQNLRKAVIDMPAHAPPGDERSIDSLSVLLNHEDVYVRKGACRAIGLLGGGRARSVLERVAKTGDTEMSQVVSDSILSCDTLEVTGKLNERQLSKIENCRKEIENLEKTVEEMWTSDEARTAVANSMRAHQRFAQVVRAVYVIFLVEILIVSFLFLLGKIV